MARDRALRVPFVPCYPWTFWLLKWPIWSLGSRAWIYDLRCGSGTGVDAKKKGLGVSFRLSVSVELQECRMTQYQYLSSSPGCLRAPTLSQRAQVYFKKGLTTEDRASPTWGMESPIPKPSPTPNFCYRLQFRPYSATRLTTKLKSLAIIGFASCYYHEYSYCD